MPKSKILNTRRGLWSVPRYGTNNKRMPYPSKNLKSNFSWLTRGRVPDKPDAKREWVMNACLPSGPSLRGSLVNMQVCMYTFIMDTWYTYRRYSLLSLYIPPVVGEGWHSSSATLPSGWVHSRPSQGGAQPTFRQCYCKCNFPMRAPNWRLQSVSVGWSDSVGLS